MSKSKLIAFFMVFALAAGIGFLVFRGSVGSPQGGAGPAQETTSVVETKWDKGDQWDKRDKGDMDGSTSSPQADWMTYDNSTFGFSLKHPKEFRVSELNDEKGLAVLFEEAGGGSTGSPQGREFQIFISEFDEPGLVTPERIKQDLPNIKVEDAKEVLIGKDKNLRALIFFSQNELVGKTREVWFIWPEDPRARGNFLYQVTTYPDLDNLVGPILETWKFN